MIKVICLSSACDLVKGDIFEVKENNWYYTTCEEEKLDRGINEDELEVFYLVDNKLDIKMYKCIGKYPKDMFLTETELREQIINKILEND